MKIMLLYPTWTTNYGITEHFAKRGSTWTIRGLTDYAKNLRYISVYYYVSNLDIVYSLVMDSPAVS